MLTLTDCSLGTSPLHASAHVYLLTALGTIIPVLEETEVSKQFILPEGHTEYMANPVHLVLSDSEATPLPTLPPSRADNHKYVQRSVWLGISQGRAAPPKSPCGDVAWCGQISFQEIPYI